MSHDGFRGGIAESLVGANVGLHFTSCNGCLIGCSNCNFTIVALPLKWVSVTIIMTDYVLLYNGAKF